MKYCTDTWYILKLFANDINSLAMLDSIKHGKNILIVPIVVISEAFKKLLQHGIPERVIESFFESMEISDNIEIILLDRSIAKEGAKVSLSYSIPLLDSLIAATSKLTECDRILTNDEHFKLLERKKYLKIENW